MPDDFFPNYIDLSQPDGMPRLIEAPGIPTPITVIRRKRGTAPPQGVQFIRDGLPVDMSGITLSFVLKQVGEYDGEAVAAAVGAAWTEPGEAGGFWTGKPSFGTTQINTDLLAGDGNALNDVPSKTYMGAFRWRVGSEEPTETEEFQVIVVNKVINDDEGEPEVPIPNVSWDSIGFVADNGDNSTAQLGNQFKPFAELQDAFDAGATAIGLFPKAGSYGGITSTTAITLTLFAFAADTLIGSISSPAGVTLTGNGLHMISLNSVSTVPTAAGAGGGAIQLRGLLVGLLNSSGSNATDPDGDGGNAGEITLQECHVTESISRLGGEGNGAGIDGSEGILTARFSAFNSDPGTGTFAACIVAGVLVDSSLPIVAPPFASLTDGATVTIACDAKKAVQNHTLTLGGNRTLAFTGLTNGMTGVLQITQDATGGRTLALPAGSLVAGGGGGVLTLTATANAVDVVGWYYNGSKVVFVKSPNAT